MTIAFGSNPNKLSRVSQIYNPVDYESITYGDPFANETVLLLKGDGTNATQNNTFVDSSSNNFSITRNGNATQGTFSPYGTSWSNYFDGSDYLEVAASSAFAFGTGDFTVEAWIFNANSTGTRLVSNRLPQGGASGTWSFGVSNDSISFTEVVVGEPGAGGYGNLLNRWAHVAATRSSSTLRIFIDGKLVASVGSYTNNFNNTSYPLRIGTSINESFFTGYISNLRIIKGTALYTSDFTPPTSQLTAVTNTSLLTCHTNRLIDSSANSFAVARSGDVSVQRFSPFIPTVPYAAGTIGGSGYFDGSGDWLNISSAPPTSIRAWAANDFTVEAWVYPTSFSGWSYNDGQTHSTLIGNRSATTTGDYWSFGPCNDGVVRFYYWNGSTATTVSSGLTIPLSQWSHVAFTKTSSGIRFFVNGVASGFVAINGTPVTGSDLAFTVGLANNTALTGYVGDLRIVNGTAVYSGSTYSVPTGPLTAIANTSLLLNFTNGGIIDSTMISNIETVGNAQVNTSIKKYGSGSLAFDGSGDRLVMPPSVNLDLSNGDFTVEAWVYSNTIAAGAASACCRAAAGNIATGAELQWNIYRVGSSLYVRPYQGTTDYTINIGTIAANTWYHVALTRSGNTFRGFLNGVQAGTTQTISGALNNNTAWFGAIVGLITVNSVNEAWNGYIDDLRITKGIARYTTTFTPPTKELPYAGPIKVQSQDIIDLGGVEVQPAEYNVLLLNGNGVNGAQNNTFLDSSTNNLTITRNGNTTQGTFSPFGTLWSNYFDGTGDYLYAGQNNAFAFGTGDFTVEFFIYTTSATSQMVFDTLQPNISGGGGNRFFVYINSDQTVIAGNATNFATSTNKIQLGAWSHVAVVRSGSTRTIYINGVSGGSSSFTNDLTSNYASIGFDVALSGTIIMNGYLSNLRVVKGTAVYTTAFTPPTAPLTAITNTSLLTCQSNRLRDASANNFTITRNGDVRVERFSPYVPTAEYSTTTIGGSGYYDGTGDNLTLSNTAAIQLTNSTAFTVECWVYLNVATAATFILQAYNPSSPFSGYGIRISPSTGEYEFWDGGSWTSFGAAARACEWVHLAVSYEGSGTTRRLFVNGRRIAAAGTVPSGINYTTGTVFIGSSNTGNNLNGFISNFRIVKGTAVYTADFTPSSTPLTAITNTGLLLNFTNGGIIDDSAVVVAETIGNAQINTSIRKYGSGSLAFDSVGDRLVFPSNPAFNFGTGDFTIEFWLNSLDVSGSTQKGILQTSDTAGGLKTTYTSGITIAMGFNTAGQALTGAIGLNLGGTNLATEVAVLATNTWYHIAVVRLNGTVTIYVNGLAVRSGTASANITGSNLVIGGYYDTTYLYNGYLDDIRITKGYARYTTAFTPPVATLPDF